MQFSTMAICQDRTTYSGYVQYLTLDWCQFAKILPEGLVLDTESHLTHAKTHARRKGLGEAIGVI